MDTLKIHMKMNNPNDANFWLNLKDLAQTIVPWLSAGWVFHQAINKIFKYFSDSRDAELREIVRKEVQPKLDDMSRKIDHLSDLIFELKNK